MKRSHDWLRAPQLSVNGLRAVAEKRKRCGLRIAYGSSARPDLWEPRAGNCPGRPDREHVRQKKGYHRMREEDRRAKTPESTVRLLSRAGTAGESIGIVCQAIHHEGGEVGVRRILGVLSLVKKYGPGPVEQACQMVLEVQLPTYQFVRRYVGRQQAQLPLALTQEYHLGRRRFPRRIYFIGGDHEPYGFLGQFPNGSKIAANCHYVGHAAAFTLAGIRITGVSGIHSPYEYPKNRP